MANTITNIADFSNTSTTTKELTHTEELQRINQVKYNLSLVFRTPTAQDNIHSMHYTTNSMKSV